MHNCALLCCYRSQLGMSKQEMLAAGAARSVFFAIMPIDAMLKTEHLPRQARDKHILRNTKS
jgi:hypothetical protein